MTKKKTKKKKVKKKSVKKVTSTVPPAQVSSKPKVTHYPDSSKVVSEFEQTLDRQLAGDMGPPEPKRGPGRPPKEKEPEPERPELTIDVVAGVVKIPFELWSISQSVKSLSLADDEAKRIAEPAMQLLEHYLPAIPVIAYAWISLSVSTFWVMQSRLLIVKKIQEHKKSQEQPAKAEPSGPGVETKFSEKLEPTKI